MHQLPSARLKKISCHSDSEELTAAFTPDDLREIIFFLLRKYIEFYTLGAGETD